MYYIKNHIIYSIIVLAMGAGICSCHSDNSILTSPDKKLVIDVKLDEHGVLKYSISLNKIEIIPSSVLGMNSTDSTFSFSEGLKLKKVSEQYIDETYTLPTGKVNLYRNKCNEKVYRFQNEAGNYMNLECRAYNDGVAFRYVLEKNGKIQIKSENTHFQIPENADTWIMDYRLDHENYYPKRTYKDINSTQLSYPALFKINNYWLLLTEANVFNHPATHLNKSEMNGLSVAFPEESFVLTGRYESPWRTFIIGEKLAAIVESVMIENLNPPTALKDTSWIRPGVAVFPWWGNYMANTYIDTLKMYVDMAAEMKWNWIEFDVSLVGEPSRTSKKWETTDWLKDFTNYSNSRGVNVYGWDEYSVLNTKEGRDHVYGRYRDLGIKGIKIDFINSDKLEAMRFREEAMKDASIYGLMVSFHGETIPRGQRRKYPNLMTCEGVKGAEYYGFGNGPTPEYNCTLPFTRNVIGPMDYTPVTFTSKDKFPRTTTYAHELALPFVFESGWVVMADRPEAYLKSPAKEILQKIKATWDETRFIDGYPGEFICLARRHRNGWYIGAINAGKERTINLNLNFLKKGTYTFNVYEDDPNTPMDNIRIRKVTASAGEELQIKLIPNGGFCTVIE